MKKRPLCRCMKLRTNKTEAAAHLSIVQTQVSISPKGMFAALRQIAVNCLKFPGNVLKTRYEGVVPRGGYIKKTKGLKYESQQRSCEPTKWR